MKKNIACIVAAITASIASDANAGRPYSIAGSTITEDFNSLPLVPSPIGTSGAVLSNNTIMQSAGAGYTTGWVNDTGYLSTSDPNDIGITGLHLFHAFVPTGGFAGPSQHSRYVQGAGSPNGAGGFWAFNSGTDTTVPAYAEKAIGSVATSVGAVAIANAANPMRIGYELVNTTGAVLTRFTLTYDGEQYMDGRFATPETLRFSYSLTDTASSYQSTWGNAQYTPVPALDFTAPSAQNFAGPGPSLVVDGNLPENRAANITSTVSGIQWAPDTSIFLLWTDQFVSNGTSGDNDGLAIDNIRFSATGVLSGDFDADGDRDAADIDILLATQSGTVPPLSPVLDLNADGTVNSVPNSPGSDADVWVKTLKQTAYGDTNLDSAVNFDDLLALAQHYSLGTSQGWADGSFDGDGAVDFDDLLLLAQNYGFGTLQGPSSGAAFARDWALARSLVPEPMTMSLTIVAAVGALRGRRVSKC